MICLNDSLIKFLVFRNYKTVCEDIVNVISSPMQKIIQKQFFSILPTIGSKIIRTLKINRAKKLIRNAVLSNKYFSNHDL